ncbi:MAG TPA: DUF2000 domain-containing protein [Gaiellales bacterium]
MTTEMRTPQPDLEPIDGAVPERCVIVVDDALPVGLAANAAAVLSLTLGARASGLIGGDVVDADGSVHPGLIDRGLPILRAPASQLGAIRARALESGVRVIDFPSFGQQTTDYDAFREQVARTPTDEIAYLGLLLYGPKRSVGRLTGSFPLLR